MSSYAISFMGLFECQKRRKIGVRVCLTCGLIIAHIILARLVGVACFFDQQIAILPDNATAQTRQERLMRVQRYVEISS